MYDTIRDHIRDKNTTCEKGGDGCLTTVKRKSHGACKLSGRSDA